MEENSGLEISGLIGKKDLAAYESYLQLTTYQNFFLTDQTVLAANKDYSSRDMSFPVDLLIKE